MANVQEVIIGGKGTICLGAGQSLDNVSVEAVFIRENAPNLKLYRERFENETSDTEVTADHFVSTTPLQNDLIRGKAYKFKKIEVGASGSVTLILG